MRHKATPGIDRACETTASPELNVRFLTYIVQVRRNHVRARVSPSDEADSDDQSEHAHGRSRGAVQPPRQRNPPRPREQNEGRDGAGQCGIRDRERDASGRGVAPHVLVVLRVDRRQNDSSAQSDGDAPYAVHFALPLACGGARGEKPRLGPLVRYGKHCKGYVQATSIVPASAKEYPAAFCTLRTNQWQRAPPPSL